MALGANMEIRENIYGHKKRLLWFKKHLNISDSVAELGCGTGYMITIPLVQDGYNVIGVDLDQDSIEYGHKLLQEEGIDSSCLRCVDIKDIHIKVDTIIVSEVLEHIEDQDLSVVLKNLHSMLSDQGKLLVTVPNGYGWFEFESFLWNKMKIGRFLEIIYLAPIIGLIKTRLLNIQSDIHPSTLSSSPHVQRFTLNRIKSLLEGNGFTIYEYTGSVLFAGQFSHLLFSGIKWIMKFNNFLGDVFPRLASGFYIACEVKKSCEDA